MTQAAEFSLFSMVTEGAKWRTIVLKESLRNYERIS